MKLGLFGGSFDPIHLGHLLVARAAREEAALDRIFFIPAAQSPFKAAVTSASAQQRLRLVRLALAGDTSAEVDESELRRGGISFSIDTVRDYQKRFPGAELFYLIGADQTAQLHLWREAAKLARLAQFLVIPRPGEATAELPPPFRGQALRGFPFGVSSSEIRRRIKAALPIEYLVPAAVAEAIKNNALYL